MSEPKTKCSNCGAAILQRTADRHEGLCVPCHNKATALPPDDFDTQGGNRDGTSVEKAIVVGSVEEEYAWMQRHCPGFQPGLQALQFVSSKPYDVLTWHNRLYWK